MHNIKEKIIAVTAILLTAIACTRLVIHEFEPLMAYLIPHAEASSVPQHIQDEYYSYYDNIPSEGWEMPPEEIVEKQENTLKFSALRGFPDNRNTLIFSYNTTPAEAFSILTQAVRYWAW